MDGLAEESSEPPGWQRAGRLWIYVERSYSERFDAGPWLAWAGFGTVRASFDSEMEKDMRQGLRFGAFLAPHHPLGEHPTLQFQRDLELAALLDRLQFDEFWVGEHHSAGWETIGSPEMFLVAAAERTHHIRLGTGVISVPYHHPFNIAQRMVHLDHLSRGPGYSGRWTRRPAVRRGHAGH